MSLSGNNNSVWNKASSLSVYSSPWLIANRLFWNPVLLISSRFVTTVTLKEIDVEHQKVRGCCSRSANWAKAFRASLNDRRWNEWEVQGRIICLQQLYLSSVKRGRASLNSDTEALCYLENVTKYSCVGIVVFLLCLWWHQLYNCPRRKTSLVSKITCNPPGKASSLEDLCCLFSSYFSSWYVFLYTQCWCETICHLPVPSFVNKPAAMMNLSSFLVTHFFIYFILIIVISGFCLN